MSQQEFNAEVYMDPEVLENIRRVVNNHATEGSEAIYEALLEAGLDIKTQEGSLIYEAAIMNPDNKSQDR